MAVISDDKWVKYNPLLDTYDTRDGTRVAAEIVESACCLADILYISILRDEQRKRMRELKKNDA